MLGESGTLAPLPIIKDVTDLDNDSFTYPIITGEYTLGKTLPKWESSEVLIHSELKKPEPVFIKLDKDNIKEEIERLNNE
jgi:methionyl-tRNA synthetase